MFTALLERLGLAFAHHSIDYMVIGGQAVLLYDEPRLTRVIEITLGMGVERLPALLDLTREIPLAPLVDPESFTAETLVLPCVEEASGIRVDFVFSFSPYEQAALGRVNRVSIGKAQVSFASLEDLLIHKVVAGRPRDLEDVRVVLAKNPQVDHSYVEDWLTQFSTSLEEPFLARYREIRRAVGDV